MLDGETEQPPPSLDLQYHDLLVYILELERWERLSDRMRLVQLDPKQDA